MKRNWKRVRPTSLLNALELCTQYALAKKNAGVQRVAEGMGEETHHNLYKYLGNGRMPLVKLRAFEDACGVPFVTRWLAMSAGLLVIDMPAGRNTGSDDLVALQEVLNNAVGALIAFHRHQKDADDVLARITAGLEGLAWHRENVRKYNQPELDL